MVVVDSRLAFIGGLDLCFGRYDTHTHQLVDYHPTGRQPTIWPGQDYSNPRIKDFANGSLKKFLLIANNVLYTHFCFIC